MHFVKFPAKSKQNKSKYSTKKQQKMAFGATLTCPGATLICNESTIEVFLVALWATLISCNFIMWGYIDMWGYFDITFFHSFEA